MDIHCWWEPFHCSRQKGRSARLRSEKSSENKTIVKITEKSERKIGLVVPDNFVHIAKDKNCLVILEAELEKRKTLFQDLKLKFYKIGVCRGGVYSKHYGISFTHLLKQN